MRRTLQDCVVPARSYPCATRSGHLSGPGSGWRGLGLRAAPAGAADAAQRLCGGACAPPAALPNRLPQPRAAAPISGACPGYCLRLVSRAATHQLLRGPRSIRGCQAWSSPCSTAATCRADAQCLLQTTARRAGRRCTGATSPQASSGCWPCRWASPPHSWACCTTSACLTWRAPRWPTPGCASAWSTPGAWACRSRRATCRSSAFTAFRTSTWSCLSRR